MYTYGCMPTSFFSHKVDCQGPAIGRNYWTIPILLRLLVFSIVSCCNLHHVVYYGLRHLATYWLMRGSSRPGSPINSKLWGDLYLNRRMPAWRSPWGTSGMQRQSLAGLA